MNCGLGSFMDSKPAGRRGRYSPGWGQPCDCCQEETTLTECRLLSGRPEAAAFPADEVRTTSFAPEIQPTAECCRNFHFAPWEGGRHSIPPICLWTSCLRQTAYRIFSLSLFVPIGDVIRTLQTVDRLPPGRNAIIVAQLRRFDGRILQTACPVSTPGFSNGDSWSASLRTDGVTVNAASVRRTTTSRPSMADSDGRRRVCHRTGLPLASSRRQSCPHARFSQRCGSGL